MRRQIYNAARFPEAPLPLPGWVGVLQAAQEWGCPPWEITGERPEQRLMWFMRRGAYQQEMARAQRAKGKGKQADG